MNHELFNQWIQAKAIEADAVLKRRDIEDELSKAFGLNESDEGAKTHKVENFVVKITQRMSKKIDADALQEIASQEGLSDHLNTLFRWKPELDKKAWDSASESITGPLSDAITLKSGRPSYSIILQEEK